MFAGREVSVTSPAVGMIRIQLPAGQPTPDRCTWLKLVMVVAS
jgi:hypothetical protein